MNEPIVGITTYQLWNKAAYAQLCLNQAYSTAVQLAGGIPVLIPLGLSDEFLDPLCERLDGVLFSGGGDIHPSRYGSSLHPKVDNVDLDRDRIEISLVKKVVERGLPFLGICRGLQVINVALGGTLYEDINDQRPGSLNHQTPDDLPRDQISHLIHIETGCRLHQILGANQLSVNSWHHQAVKQLAPTLIPTAYSPDGIIEAVELAFHPFGLAVQWHPEWLQGHESMKSLFRAFIDAARTYRLNNP